MKTRKRKHEINSDNGVQVTHDQSNDSNSSKIIDSVLKYNNNGINAAHCKDKCDSKTQKINEKCLSGSYKEKMPAKIGISGTRQKSGLKEKEGKCNSKGSRKLQGAGKKGIANTQVIDVNSSNSNSIPEKCKPDIGINKGKKKLQKPLNNSISQQPENEKCKLNTNSSKLGKKSSKSLDNNSLVSSKQSENKKCKLNVSNSSKVRKKSLDDKSISSQQSESTKCKINVSNKGKKGSLDNNSLTSQSEPEKHKLNISNKGKKGSLNRNSTISSLSEAENTKQNSNKAKVNKKLLKSKSEKNESAKPQAKSSPSKKLKLPNKNISQALLESDSDLSDWEEVDEFTEILRTNADVKNNPNDVKIELQVDDFWARKLKRKRRTEQELIEDYLRKQVNKATREVALNVHKTHLLCLLAHGIYLNNLLSSDDALSYGRALIPKKYYLPQRLNLDHLEKFLSWFTKNIKLVDNDKEKYASYSAMLKDRFDKKSSRSNKELVLMFISTSRAAGMKVRLIQSLNPHTWKPDASTLIKPNKQTSDTSDLKSDNCITQKLEKPNDTSSLSPNPSTSNAGLKNSQKKKRKSSDLAKCNGKDSDEDFAEPKITKSKKKLKTGENISPKRNQKDAFQDWAEVFVEEEEMWVSVDVKRNKVHCSQEIEARCSNLAYVVAFNPDRSLKDVTKRYVSNFLSAKNKIQCDEDWWKATMEPFSQNSAVDDSEEKEMEQRLNEAPLPKSIAEYKNHPLYALERHLLKFEAIYPPDIQQLGHIKGEAVFPRSAVKTLHSKDIWIKEAKSVRVDEKPYKIVKARPKWDKNLCEMVGEKKLEVFGDWQVEDYEPPIAVNGKVPRNEYGNVYLFKSCMVPRGCVHLPINGLGRIARKLDIDCVPAVTGFEFQRGGSYPVMDGFVVCEEYRDLLVDAWNEEQGNIARREEEKRINRIYGNWKRIIKSIILKDRLKEKYGLIGKSENTKKKEIVAKKDKVDHPDVETKTFAPSDVDTKTFSPHDVETKAFVSPDIQAKTFVHYVPTLKIDMNASCTDKPRKNVTKRPKNSRKPKTKVDISAKDQISSDSDLDDQNEEKREKIRSILDWNPDKSASLAAEPNLSDESGDEVSNNNNLFDDSLSESSDSLILSKPKKELNSQVKEDKKSSTKRSSRSVKRTGTKSYKRDESDDEVSSENNLFDDSLSDSSIPENPKKTKISSQVVEEKKSSTSTRSSRSAKRTATKSYKFDESDSDFE